MWEFRPQRHKKFVQIQKKSYLCTLISFRDVVQSGRIHVWGACGREFESRHPDIKNQALAKFSRCFFCVNGAKKWGNFLVINLSLKQ